MEAGRSEKIKELSEQGWYFDDECEQRQRADGAAGTGTYMKSPDGTLHTVSVAEVKPV